VAAFLALLGTGLLADKPPRRFLVIYELHSSLVANIEIASGIEDKLAEALPAEREVYSVYLDSARFPGNPTSAHFLNLLKDSFSRMIFDAVLAVGPAALSFALEHRDNLAPGVPILFTGIAGEEINEADLPPNVGGVYRAYDMAKLVEFAMKLRPDARRIVVMSGSAGFDRRLVERARRALGTQFANLPVFHISDLPLAGYVEAARGYDSNTILIILTILRDATGQAMLPNDAAREIASVSGAPTFGFHSTFLQAGVTGGHVTTFPDIGRLLANEALAAIEGEGRRRLQIAEAPAHRCRELATTRPFWHREEPRSAGHGAPLLYCPRLAAIPTRDCAGDHGSPAPGSNHRSLSRSDAMAEARGRGAQGGAT
jgi:hypothetical protein